MKVFTRTTLEDQKGLKCSDWPSSKLMKFPSGLTESNTSSAAGLELRMFQMPPGFTDSPKRRETV